MLPIITPEARAAEPHGIKILIMGPPGIGKTWQARYLPPHETLFLDSEAGTLGSVV